MASFLRPVTLWLFLPLGMAATGYFLVAPNIGRVDTIKKPMQELGIDLGTVNEPNPSETEAEPKDGKPKPALDLDISAKRA